MKARYIEYITDVYTTVDVSTDVDTSEQIER